MGYFKEEIRTFEMLETQRTGYYTDKITDGAALETLRNLMKQMIENKLFLERGTYGDTRFDTFFIAYEVDGGHVNGIHLKVTTQKLQAGNKYITLESAPRIIRLETFKAMDK